MIDDLITQQHGFILARQYNLSPYDNLKCERILPTPEQNSLWLATKNRDVRCFVKYNVEDLETPA